MFGGTDNIESQPVDKLTDKKNCHTIDNDVHKMQQKPVIMPQLAQPFNKPTLNQKIGATNSFITKQASNEHVSNTNNHHNIIRHW